MTGAEVRTDVLFKTRTQPASFEYELRPSGQVDPVFEPFDALAAAWRDHFDIPRRRRHRRRGYGRAAGAGAGRLGWADAALPDQNAHAVRRFHLRERDVGAIGKFRMMLDRRAERVQPRFEQRIVEQHALRVADRQRDGLHPLAGGFELDRTDVLRALPSTPGTSARRRRGLRARALWHRPACSIVTSCRARALADSQRSQAANAVARDFGRAAVGVEQAHADGGSAQTRRSSVRRRRCRRAGCTSPARAREIAAAHLRFGHEQKVVAVGVPFDDGMPFGIGYTSQNASRCQPKRLVSERGIALNSPTKNVL